MARPEPRYRRADFAVGGGTFPARAMVAFEGNHAGDTGPARHIEVEAGRRGTWVVRFAPEADLPAGAKVGFRKVENDFRFDYRHQDYWPDAMGYVTAEDGDGRALPFECDTCLKSRVPAVVTLPEGLAAGAELVLRIGDQRAGGPGTYVSPARYALARLATGVKLPEEEQFRAAPGATVSVTVVSCPPVRRYHLFAPSAAQPGEEVEAVALPVDINGNLLEAGQVEVTLRGAPAQTERTGLGTVRVRARVGEEGVAQLELEDPAAGLRARSNPLRVSSDGRRICWGEFHCHGFDGVEINVLNDGTHPDGAYCYGRDAARLDFMAMGSHVFRHRPEAVGQWWEMYREAAQRYDEEGRYVTFLGCEWRDREPDGGDRNLVWKDLDAPMPDPTWKIDQVYERFRGRGAMVIPHVGGAIAVPARHDPDVETLCEMVSGHGQFEWFAQAYLQKGYRLGLIGGSDGHKATPGHPRIVSRAGGRFYNLLRRRDSGWSGGPLLAVCADALDREALWRAFRQRRTYASTGARALVEFRVNGAPMGSEVRVGRDAEIEFALHGTAPVSRIDLIRGPHRLRRWECSSAEVSNRLVDRPPAGGTYYYLRIEQADGEMLWTSPVWAVSTSGGPAADLPAWNEPEDIELSDADDDAAFAHLPDLLRYLGTEEKLEAFSDLTPWGLVESPRGSYAVFLGYVRGRRVRIHWFYEFEMPRLRLEAKWVQYGRERIKDAPWTRPLFDGQDAM